VSFLLVLLYSIPFMIHHRSRLLHFLIGSFLLLKVSKKLSGMGISPFIAILAAGLKSLYLPFLTIYNSYHNCISAFSQPYDFRFVFWR
jgi:hypothetical protein